MSERGPSASAVRVVDSGFTILSDGGANPSVDIVFVHGLGGHPQRTWSTSAHLPSASAESRSSKLASLTSKVKQLVRRKPSHSATPATEGLSTMSAVEQSPSSASGDAEASNLVCQIVPSLGDIFWPRDLLARDFENVRILTFGYESNPRGAAQNNLYTLSKSLLGRLANERADDPKRPLLFVCHSLGGILTKFALKISQDSSGAEAHLKAIRDSTWGVTFFGTPHAGSDLADWGELLSRIGGIFAATNTTLLAALNAQKDNGQLEQLRDDFNKMLGPRREGKFRVHNFRETKPLLPKPHNPAARLVVPLASSHITSEWASGLTIDADHRAICKFGGFDDPKYKDLKETMKGYLRDILEEPAADENNEIISAERMQYEPDKAGYLHSLKFRNKKLDFLNNLRKWIAPASSEVRHKRLQGERLVGTCEWIRNEEAFLKWVNVDGFDWVSRHASNSRYLWIFGKPGSGKSVLFSYIKDIVSEMIESHDRTIAAADQRFSDDKYQTRVRHLGGTDERTLLYFSVEGDVKASQIVASLVDQVLDRFVGDPTAYDIALEFQSKNRKDNKMSLSLGIKLLVLLIVNLSQTFIIIDGLDECSDRSDLLHCMEPLKQLQGVRLLFLSQDEPVIRGKIFDYCSEGMTINTGQMNGAGLGVFIKTKIETSVTEMGSVISKDLSRSIIKRLEQEANGMFLWAALIVPYIKPLLNNERNKETIFKEIDRFPRTLDDTYKKLLNQFGGDSGDETRARSALRWILCSVRPLQLHELRVILALEEPEPDDTSGAVSTSRYRQCADECSHESSQFLRGYFVGLLGSLIEIRNDDDLVFTLHSCHPSLSRLLTQDHPVGSGAELPKEMQWRRFCFTETEAHENAAKLCMRVVANPVDYEEFLSRYYQKDRDLPFLRYACENWDRHLRACSLPYNRPEEVLENINMVLDTMLKLTTNILAKLAAAFERVNIRKANQMFQLVALRDCQSAILPAVTAIKDSLEFVSPLNRALASINVGLGNRTSITKSLRRRRTFSRKPDLVSNGIDASLDSAVIRELQKATKESPDLFKPHRSGFLALQKATRKLRGLSMRLSVKPIRDLISELVGEAGIHPLPAFSFTTHALDIFMVSAFIPRLRNEPIDFSHQFICDTTNPYFGMLSGVQAELEERGNDFLSADFYETHILPHYQLTLSERARIRVEVLMLSYPLGLERGLTYSSHYAGALVLKSVNDPLTSSMLYKPSLSFGNRYESKIPYTAVEKFDWMQLAGPSSSWAAAWAPFSVFNLSPILDLIFAIAPKLLNVFEGLFDILTIRFDYCRRHLLGCMHQKRYTLIALSLYAIRWYYFPSHFSNLYDSPIPDLKFALNDPVQYLNKPSAGLGKVLLFVLRNSLTHTLIELYSEPDWARLRDEQSPYGPLPKICIRGASICTRFYGFIYLEHQLTNVVYILINGILYSRALYSPASYSWSKICSNLTTNAIFLRSRDLDSRKFVFLLILRWFGGVIWRLLRFHRLLRFFYDRTIMPLLSPLSIYILVPLWMFVYHNVVRAIPAILDTAFWTKHFALFMGIRAYVPVTAVAILAYFCYQATYVLDPLDIDRSNRSCQKAIQSLEPLLKESRPFHSLRWAVSSKPTVLPVVLPNSDLLGLSNAERIENRRNSSEGVLGQLSILMNYLSSSLLRFGNSIQTPVGSVKDIVSLLSTQSPDINPQLLARQCNISPARRPGESSVYRNLAIMPNSPLVSGLNIKDDGSSKWRKGRDGDLRDIWRQAVKGTGRLMTVLDTGDIFEHDLVKSSQNISAVGKYLVKQNTKRMAIYLPNSIEILEALFAAVFYGITPIILPNKPSVLAQQLQLASPDTLIYTGSKTGLDEVALSCLELKHIIWVSPTANGHVVPGVYPEVIGDDIKVTAWHHIPKDRGGSSLPDKKSADHVPDITMYWQKEEDDPGQVYAIPQRCIVAAISASISDLPQSQRFKSADLFLSTEHLSYSYAFILSLAALFSNTPTALTPMASPKADLAIATRYISPTIIIASSVSVRATHLALFKKFMKLPIQPAVIISLLRQMKLNSGVIPPGNWAAYLKIPLLGADPATPRLVYTSHPLGTNNVVMLTRALMWLRIRSGARFIYALTSKDVAGAVAQSGVFDYRHKDEFPLAHFGPPAGSVELKLRMPPSTELSRDEVVTVGEIVVSGPAVIGHSEVGLNAVGKMDDDGTLMIIEQDD